MKKGADSTGEVMNMRKIQMVQWEQ